MSIEHAVEEPHVSQEPIDLAAATRVVRSGLSYDLLCSRCDEIIRHDVRTTRAAMFNAERVAKHIKECRGTKKWWRRKLFPRRAV